MKFETPYVDFEYEETRYDEYNKVLFFYASYCNGDDPYETVNRGTATLDFSDGNVLTYDYNITSELENAISMFDSARLLDEEGKLFFDSSMMDKAYLDIDMDGNNDVIFLWDIGTRILQAYALDTCSVKGTKTYELSNESIIKEKAQQREFGFFEKIIIIFDEEEVIEPLNPTDDSGNNDGNSDGNNDVPLHKEGEKISDKKYTYEITKGETLGVTSLPEVKVTGLKKKSLKQIKIATEVTIDGTTYMVTAIDKNAFKGNKKITKVTIGKNVKSIGANAFKNCTKLKQVSCNSKVLNNIGKNAFAGDKKLSKVIIKSTKLKKVGKKAFLRKGGKKLTFKVPKAKKKAYKKLLKKAKTNKFAVK